MRVLVAGRNAKVLAKAAGTFANDLQIHTAASKAACFTLLQRTDFDLIVACETLADGSGLEVLSHVAVNTPNTLRIFAARPATLNLLKGELGLFGLFRTLPYPINFRNLWAAISLARSTCGDAQPPAPRVKHIVLEDTWESNATPEATKVASPPAPAARSAPTQQPQPARQPAAELTSGMRAAARYAAAHSTPFPARIPESEAFKRARARRTAGSQRTDGSQPADGRREPVMSNDSLSQLAQLAAARKPTRHLRGAPPGKKRAVLFVGSGVFAAATAAVLTFFMVNANHSVERSKLPMIASNSRPAQNQVIPWATAPAQQPMRQAAFVRSESAATADMDVEAEAASESTDGEPGHPGPPPPYAPPPPSEPPSLDSPEQSAE